SQDGVEDDEELADAGGERLFAGFSGCSELLIMGGDHRICAACDQRGHTEGGPDRGSPARDGFAAARDAAVAIDRGDANGGCVFAWFEAAELRKLGDEGAQGRLAYSWHAGQEVGVGLPGWALADRRVDVAIEFGKLGLQEIDMPVDGLEDAPLTGETTAVL